MFIYSAASVLRICTVGRLRRRLCGTSKVDGKPFHLCDGCHFKLNGIKIIIQTYAVLSFVSVGIRRWW